MKIIVPEATKKGYDVATYGDSINTAFPNSKTRRGRVGHGVAQTLTTSDAQQVVIEPRIITVRNYSPSAHNAARIVDAKGIAPTIMENHGTVTAIAEEEKYRFCQQAIETLQENDCEPGDTIDAYNKRVNKDGISPTITTDDLPDNASVAGVDLLPYRIRKLTPRECFRLMGVKREDYEAAAKHQSVSSQYHLAGDSIVTTCLMAIFGELLSIDHKTKITELTEELLDAD